MAVDTLFTAAEEHLENKLPFVLYRKPTSQILNAVFQQDDTLYLTTDFKEEGFVFAPFDSNDSVVIIPFSEASRTRETISEASEVAVTNTHLNPQTEKDKPAHIHLIERALEAIKNSKLDKVVLSRIEEHSTEKTALQVFKTLLFRYQDAFSYLWYHPKVGVWLGATPETLLNISGSRFKTMALAGTQKADVVSQLSWTAKEKKEQQIVTNEITSRLKPFSRTITVADPHTIKAGNLYHINTAISGNFNSSVQLAEILRELHPTPAICGYPKIGAKEFIMAHEGYNREFYTGFLGEINITTERTKNNRNTENKAYRLKRTQSELYVNLRCLQLKQQKAYVYVGGGITAESVPEAEWQETINKAETMGRVL